jgi:SAM-dependent methyltransferase
MGDSRLPARDARQRSGAWPLVRTADGSWTAIEPVGGRALHDLAGARTEARGRFARALGLDRVRGARKVRLLDVGSGLLHNLAAAVECATCLGFELEALGLEHSPAVLELAARLPADPDPRFEAARRGVGEALGGTGLRGVRVELLRGPAEALIDDLPAQGFDAVFLDGYAPSGGGPLWDPDFLRRLASKLAPGGALATYTSSALVRAALIASGLEVEAGPRLGLKAGGTIARRAGSEPAPLRPMGRPLNERHRAKLARRARRIGG